MKCPLLAMFRHVTIKVQKSNKFKVCVQDILHLLKCKLGDVNVTAWLLCRWLIDYLVSYYFHSSIKRDFSWETSWIRLQYARSCCFPQTRWSTELRSGLLAGQIVRAMKYGVSRVNSCTVSCTLWEEALSCLQMSLLGQWLITDIWRLITPLLINIS